MSVRGLAYAGVLLFPCDAVEFITFPDNDRDDDCSTLAAYAYDATSDEWRLHRSAPFTPTHDNTWLCWIGDRIAIMCRNFGGNEDHCMHFVCKQTLTIEKTLPMPEGDWQFVEATSDACVWLTDNHGGICHWDGVQGHALQPLPINRLWMRAGFGSLFVISNDGSAVHEFPESAPTTCTSCVQLPVNCYNDLDDMTVVDCRRIDVHMDDNSVVSVDMATKTCTTAVADDEADNFQTYIPTLPQPGASTTYRALQTEGSIQIQQVC